MRNDIYFEPLKSRSYARFLVITILVLILLIIVIPFLSGEKSSQVYLINGTFVLLLACLFLWIWFDTSYKITSDKLIVKSGPIKRKINISDIYLIRLNQDTFAGIMKLSLSWKSMEIKYKKYKTVSVTPINQQALQDSLLEINPSIKIKA